MRYGIYLSLAHFFFRILTRIFLNVKQQLGLKEKPHLQ